MPRERFIHAALLRGSSAPRGAADVLAITRAGGTVPRVLAIMRAALLLRGSSAPRGAALVLAIMRAGGRVPLGAGGHHARPLLLLLVLLSLAAPAAASEGPATPAAERAALVAFYEATGGAGWASNCGGPCNEGWLGPDPPCNGGTANWGANSGWSIQCDSSGSVTEL